MKYLARFHTSMNTSYMMDIFLEEQGYGINEDVPLKKQLIQHTAVSNELQRNSRIVKVEFFRGVPDATWVK